jgi:DnaK suppressor protein
LSIENFLPFINDVHLVAVFDVAPTSGSIAMSSMMTAPFQKQLQAQRANLLEQLASLRGGAVGRAEASAEHFGRPEDSDAQVNSARDLEFALDELESAELRLVDAALERIKAGTYGQCLDCAQAIPAARLQAAPEASRCIACQEKLEC